MAISLLERPGKEAEVVCDGPEARGTPIHVFARRRTIDDRLRSLVEQRDGHCRVPGCARRRWLHVHHLIHAQAGGLTIRANLCCLCPAHHRLHHAGRLGISGDPTTPDGLVFTDHRGQPIRGPSRSHPLAHPTRRLLPWGWRCRGGSHRRASTSTPSGSPGAESAAPADHRWAERKRRRPSSAYRHPPARR